MQSLLSDKDNKKNVIKVNFKISNDNNALPVKDDLVCLADNSFNTRDLKYFIDKDLIKKYSKSDIPYEDFRQSYFNKKAR